MSSVSGPCSAGYYCDLAASTPTQHVTQPGYYSFAKVRQYVRTYVHTDDIMIITLYYLYEKFLLLLSLLALLYSALLSIVLLCIPFFYSALISPDL